MTRCVVEAVVQSGVCAILTKGWSDRGQRKDGADVPKEEKEHSVPTEEQPHKDGADGIQYPDSIYAIDSIDHSWLFPRIDAACHHGGAGTTGASLRAGIPTIIKPFFGDQSFWAERVESLGVGSAIRKLTTDELANALIQATTNERQIAKAKVVGEEIRRVSQLEMDAAADKTGTWCAGRDPVHLPRPRVCKVAHQAAAVRREPDEEGLDPNSVHGIERDETRPPVHLPSLLGHRQGGAL
jgi:hypothetical protein